MTAPPIRWRNLMADDSARACDDDSLGTARPAYSARVAAIAEQLYALGATPSDVAKAFGASVEEISHWERDHGEFHEACERGRARVTREVETALYKLATGYVECDERPMKVDGEVVMTPYRRRRPPNVAAIRLMLAKGKLARDLSGDYPQDFLKQLKPKTVFDLAAENEKKWKSGIRDDE